VVYLNTKPKKDCDTHVTIRSSYERSTALCEQVQTISVEQLGRYIADCTEQEMEAISRSILISLDLDMSETPAQKKTRTWIEDRRLEVMQKDLDEAQGEAKLYHQLYDELLEKMIRIAAK